MSKEQMNFREQKHCIFNLCPVYCKQQTILVWQSEEFQSSDIQLNHLGGKVNCGKCVNQEHSGTCSCWPLHYYSWSDFLENFLNLRDRKRQKMKRLGISYLCRVLLPPVFHFIDDWLSRQQGWRRVALLPTQIEVTIFSFLNGKIFGGPRLNCMLKNTEQSNGRALIERSRERSIHQRPEYHHSQCT